MQTIGKITEELIKESPFLEEALSDGLINISSLARKLKPDIEKKLQKPVKEGAIVMALNRIEPNYYQKSIKKLTKFVKNLGDFTVRSDLSSITLANSKTLIKKQSDLLKEVSSDNKLFYSVSRGIYESTIIISSLLEEFFEEHFQKETILHKKSGLSSITMLLPEENTQVTGFYYFILKKLAWENINIVEVISTTNEFTLLFHNSDIDKAFSILIKLKS